MYKLARTISNIFNPIVISVLIVTSLAYYTMGFGVNTYRWFAASAIFGIVFTFTILIAIKKRIFSNFDISKKKERPLFFSILALIAIALFFLGLFLRVSDNISIMFFVAILGIGLYLGVNTKIKASVHLGVFIFFVSILTFLFNIWFGLLYLLVPVLAWARVTEKEHTWPEVIAGTILGIILSVCLLFLIQ